VLSQQRLSAFADAAQRQGIKALVIGAPGATLFTRGPVDQPSRIASIRKSVLSALLGMAVRDGFLDLGATIGSLGIRDYSDLTLAESRATVRQLMQARSGIYLPAAAETAQMRAQRPRRGAHLPGTHFYYNNWDFNVLGEIYQRATGQDLFAAVEQRLARPLGFQDFDARRHTSWEYDRQRSRFPAYNISLSSRDLARFGQLYLRRGSWGGRQLIPASWIQESTTPYSATGGAGWWSGYGYMWWVASSRSGSSAGNLPAGTFTAAGAGGRYVAVLPTAGLVVAMQPDERAGQPPIPLYADQTLLNRLLAMLL
jgi:CubicO group peptidase (beta-lactamase class C family)